MPRWPVCGHNGVVAVPRLVGLPFNAARQELKALGLSWKVSVVTGSYVDAAVVKQDPDAGTLLEPGEIVHIVSGPAPP